MLTRGATAEVFSCQQNGSALILREVQHEVRVWLLAFFIEKTPVVKQMRAKTRTGHFLQKLFRDDCIGIDIGGIQRNHQACVFDKFLCHGVLLI
ncbi:Uncharacterised protein [Shigella sonnei]|nr:Uncharacterised protein [Shigella sonnei]